MSSGDGRETLIEMLAAHAASIPGDTAVVFEGERTSFADVHRHAECFATWLSERGLGPGDRVMLLLSNSSVFLFAFCGVLRLGAVAVPLLPRSGTERIARFVTTSRARALIATPDLIALHREGLARLLGPEAPELLDVAEGAAWPVPITSAPPAPDDLAFLQFTSGTTGASKGVQLSHRNLIGNLRSMEAWGHFSPKDVFLNWLPMYHDMGLILLTLLPYYVGAPTVVMPTSLNVGRWLRAIETYRATTTGGPDFAYRYCLKLGDEEARYDLSSLRVALNAAEPVRASTVAAFEKRFGLSNVVRPCYGLAECSVGVTMTDLGTPIRVDPRGVVSVGRPLPGIEVAVVAGDERLGPCEPGELVVRSPGNTRGYLDDPGATAALQWGDGYVRTGDLAYVDGEGEVFILGRLKNVIQIGGQTMAPVEIEQIVDELPGVRLAAAVGLRAEDFVGETLAVFAEVRGLGAGDSEALPELGRAIVARVYEQMGLRPGRVVLVARDAIPRTFNGKTRYDALRTAWRDGSLRREGRVLWSNEA